MENHKNTTKYRQYPVYYRETSDFFMTEQQKEFILFTVVDLSNRSNPTTPNQPTSLHIHYANQST